VHIAAVVFAIPLILIAVVVGLATVQHLPASLRVRDAARISAPLWTAFGWAELVAAGVLGATLFALPAVAAAAALVLGAVFAVLAAVQLARQEALPPAVPAVAFSVLALATAGLLLAVDR
jgi:hypothetical protein